MEVHLKIISCINVNIKFGPIQEDKFYHIITIIQNLFIKILMFMNHFRYRLTNKPGGQVNFMVEEFIEQSDLPIYTPNDVIYVINADHLSAALQMIKGFKANCQLRIDCSAR